MGAKTGIQWTDSSWNPVRGCTRVSPGCGGPGKAGGCYAEKIAARFSDPGQPFHGFAERTRDGGRWTGKLALIESALTIPLRWKKPRRIFVNSMSDLFHESLPDEAIDRVFAVMALCPQHEFQVLTKRAERMRAYCTDPQTPFRVARTMDELAARRDVGMEEVRPIIGYPGYFASSHGFIYSERRGKRRRMSPDIGDQGHTRVQLYRGTSPKTADRLLVHRLILETFVGPPPSAESQGRHRDQIPTNNAVSNLRWGDQSANWDDAKRHGSHRRYSKLTEVQAAEIRSRHAAGESGEALARAFDISGTQIRNIAAGKQWATAAPIEWPLLNCWLGVSAERQQEADERIPLLLQTPAAVRFVSLEPLLGPIDLSAFQPFRSSLKSKSHERVRGILAGSLDWAIVGGESGTHVRPMHPGWARSLRDQCAEARVPFFFKQWGEFLPVGEHLPGFGKIHGATAVKPGRMKLHYGGTPQQAPKHAFAEKGVAFTSTADGLLTFRVGKKRAGRLLDGVEHSAFPVPRA